MEKKRNSVLIFRNTYEALQNVSATSYKKILNAVFSYALDGEEVELSGTDKAIYLMIKPVLDSNIKKYEGGRLGAEYGHFGGRPTREMTEKIASYNDIIEGMEFSKSVDRKVRSFIRHCIANKHILINDELESILAQLELEYDTDTAKIQALDDAIKFGYFGLKTRRGEYYEEETEA